MLISHITYNAARSKADQSRNAHGHAWCWPDLPRPRAVQLRMPPCMGWKRNANLSPGAGVTHTENGVDVAKFFICNNVLQGQGRTGRPAGTTAPARDNTHEQELRSSLQTCAAATGNAWHPTPPYGHVLLASPALRRDTPVAIGLHIRLGHVVPPAGALACAQAGHRRRFPARASLFCLGLAFSCVVPGSSKRLL